MGKTRDIQYLQKFGDRVRKLRTTKGWSQYDLAAASGVERSKLGHIERGSTNTTLSTAKLIAEAFEMTLSELVDFR